MTELAEEHERIEELLAGYALRSLTGEDAAHADRLLTEHVPSCPRCRDALAGIQAVTGDLALVPAPVQPPDLLLPRIRRDLSEAPVGRRRRVSFVAAAAGVAAIVGMSALSVTLGIRVNNVSQEQKLARDALTLAERPDASKVPLVNRSSPSSPGMTQISAPSVQEIFLVGEDVPFPAPGNVYRVWYRSGDTFRAFGDFLPEAGEIILPLAIDPSRYDEILITEEPGVTPGARPAGPTRWSAAL